MTKKEKKITDTTTEEKIKEAARTVFTQKGYHGTKTRDIAEAAGINLALLNYYFRSKEKLFEIVMLEKMQKLFGNIVPIINNPVTSLDEKIHTMVEIYYKVLSENQDLPLFVLSEIKNNAAGIDSMFHPGKMLAESVLVKQVKERRPDLNPFQVVLSLLGFILFPYIARPIFQSALKDPKHFIALMEDRKKLIPKWIELILNDKA
jgi:AcrR family transcriptional regulator